MISRMGKTDNRHVGVNQLVLVYPSQLFRIAFK